MTIKNTFFAAARSSQPAQWIDRFAVAKMKLRAKRQTTIKWFGYLCASTVYGAKA